MNRNRQILTSTFAALLCSSATAWSQTNAGYSFTYQGTLADNGTPVDGPADFRFTLYDAVTDGNMIGSTVEQSFVNVADGLFTSEINFGVDAHTGDARWLAIEVRVPAGSGTYTLLDPRQRLRPAPMALSIPALYSQTGLPGIGPNLIGGYRGNSVDGSSNGATIGGGGNATNPNSAGSNYSTVSGGQGNSANADNATVGGGALNIASGARATIPGGFNNLASGASSFAAGENARAIHNGAFVWSDSSNTLFESTANDQFIIEADGGVGIGTNAPIAELHVARAGSAPTIRIENLNSGTAGVELADTDQEYEMRLTSGNKLSFFDNTAGLSRLTLDSNGNFGIGTNTPSALLDVNGTAKVQVLEVTGADVAERFPATEAADPGMVMAIDPANPGKLCLSREAYNARVAGVVSGANGLAAGTILGNLPGNENAPAVALSGRVWVHCDTLTGAIAPGDLLTTSSVAGHAMKVTDASRAYGATIGKAMTGLAAGQRGMVLVLVNLQ